MKKLLMGVMMAAAMAANAGLWENLTDENLMSGPKVTDRDLNGKVVMIFYIGSDEFSERNYERVEKLYKSHDKNRFTVVGSTTMEKEKTEGIATKNKLTFPIYKQFKLAADKEPREEGTLVAVNQYGKIERSSRMGQAIQDFEQYLVEAITQVGMPPNLLGDVELVKYKPLKQKVKLGTNLKGVIKSLEKDVAAGDKKSATKPVVEKAQEASSILSAIKDGKSEIYDNITALTEINPEEALRLLTLYLKSFPEENADNKEKLAELKVKAAEYKKSAPKKK